MIRIPKLKALLLFIFTLIFVSPVFESLHITIPFRCFLMMSFIILFETWKISKIRILFIYGILMLIFLSTIVAIHYVDESYIYMLFNTISFLFVLSFCDETIIQDFVDYSSVFLFILEIGAIIALLYVYLGGTPIFSFANPDGRPNHLFPITLSNAYMGRFIRPAGIYDEPGAFSFFIVSVSILRINYKKDPRLTFIMMTFGLITFSLAHIITFIVLLFPIFKQFNKKERILYMLFLLFLLIIIYIYLFDVINKFIFARLVFDKSSKSFKGDTRSGQIPNTIRLINDNGILWGNFLMDSNYVKYRYGVITENPLSQLARFGIFLSLPYYSFLLFCFIAFIITHKFIYIAAIGLFLQRPYSHLFGYATFFILFYKIALQDIYKVITSLKIFILEKK